MGVTGALLYAGDIFFQYFEGPDEGVSAVYSKIKQSSKHNAVRELLCRPIHVREFSAWHMGFSEAPSNILQDLAHEYWETTLPKLEGQNDSSPGLILLLDFWRSVSAYRIADAQRLQE